MALSLIAGGATRRKAHGGFHNTTYKGIAMTYKSNGRATWRTTPRSFAGMERPIPSVAIHYAGRNWC